MQISWKKPSKDEQAAVLSGKVVAASVPTRCDLRGQRVLEASFAAISRRCVFSASSRVSQLFMGTGAAALKRWCGLLVAQRL